MLRTAQIAAISLCVSLTFAGEVSAGVVTANGWHDGKEIYYIIGG